MPEERKLVTILFADVTGSAALGETLDSEDVRALMGRYYSHARLVVIEHGGHARKIHRRCDHGCLWPLPFLSRREMNTSCMGMLLNGF